MKFADYCGKIRRIMLHNLEFAGQSPCLTSRTCDASSVLAIDPGIGICHLESFSTPNGPVNHFMAVKSVSFEAICGSSGVLFSRNVKKTLHNRLVSDTKDSLPGYATQIVLTANICYRSVHCLFPMDWLLSLRYCQDMLRKDSQNMHKVAQQFFRRLDQLEPYCRIEGHTSEEVREILAALEKVYAPALPQLNLLRWGSSIYTWLTNPVLDPTHSGRVTMNYLMKLVKTALEWSYEAKSTDVVIEMLEKAATLLVLRRNTLWIIDGVGPSVKADPASRAELVQMGEKQAEQASSPNEEQKIPPIPSTEQVVGTPSRRKAVSEVAASDTCTFSGGVPIDIKRFEQSGVSLVECPGCGRAWTLSPGGGVLRFKSHKKRKTNAPNTGRRWARGKDETDWGVIGA